MNENQNFVLLLFAITTKWNFVQIIKWKYINDNDKVALMFASMAVVLLLRFTDFSSWWWPTLRLGNVLENVIPTRMTARTTDDVLLDSLHFILSLSLSPAPACVLSHPAMCSSLTSSPFSSSFVNVLCPNVVTT